jgi:hypothetical protein
MLLTIHPLLVPQARKSTAIRLPTLWATTGPVTGSLYIIFTCRTAEEITGTVHLNGMIQCSDQEWSDATDMRNTLRINVLQRKTRYSIEEYNFVRRNARQICSGKRDSFKKICYSMDWKIPLDEMNVETFESVSNLKMGFQPKSDLCRERNWKLVAGEQQVLNI